MYLARLLKAVIAVSECISLALLVTLCKVARKKV